MFWQSGKWLALMAALSMVTASAISADEEKETKQTETTEEKASQEATPATRTVTVKVVTGKHWIGVHAMPVDDALKAQLNLKDRLIIHHVIPESPAAKAELQTHDILLKFGDKEISTLDDLVNAVSENSDKEANITILRGGKEMTVSVKPGERPSEDVLHQIVPKHDSDALKQWLGSAFRPGNEDTIIWRGVGPGVYTHILNQVAPFPQGLSISVSKEDEKPAKVVAKKDGKTYETTEDKLEELPEDIRGYVARLLHAPQVMAIKPEIKALHGDMRLRIEAQKQAAEKAMKGQQDAANSVRRIEVRTHNSGIDELRKEIEQLRKDFQELKSGKTSSDEPKKEAEADKDASEADKE